MKTNAAVIMECVGPRCTSDLSKNSNIMSMSGIIERNKTKGILKLTLRNFPDALLRRYASAKCPTANESFFLLGNEKSR